MELRLIYFNFPFWRAEASRIALHLGDVPFDDVRPGRDEFRAMKASGELPYGQLPVLDVDGVRIAQSVAIARFCGKVAGMYPDDPVDGARVDELLDTATQITAELYPSMREKDPERRAAMRHTLATETLPRWMGMLQARLPGEGGMFAGDSMTIADLVVWRLLGWLTSGVLDGIPGTLLDDTPRLLAHYQSVENHPGVQAWVKANW